MFIKMRTRSELVISAAKWNLILFVCITLASSNGLDNMNTVAPLNADSPVVASAKILDNKDPPPEYYKGPSSSNNYDSYELKYNGQTQRPTSLVSSGYFNPYLSKHGFYGTINPKDRISIDGGYYSGSEFTAGNGYAGSDRVRPYGSPQPVDIPPNGYNSNGMYGGGGGGYGAPGFGYDGGGGGGYDHGPPDGNIWPDKMNHLSKSHLFPLAGAALIGIAAALLVNPVLLQLGTVTGKRRRRRDTSRQLELPPSEKHAQNLAYNGHIEQ